MQKNIVFCKDCAKRYTDDCECYYEEYVDDEEDGLYIIPHWALNEPDDFCPYGIFDEENYVPFDR